MTEQATGSKKRKLNEPKFYAVRAGHTTGVYNLWEDCKTQITGFKGAAFKSFSTHEDAQAFVEGRDIAVPSSEGTKNGKFYGVAVGLVPGVYTDWPTAQRQILGIKGPKYKKFGTREEAAEFVRSNGKGGSGGVGLTNDAGSHDGSDEHVQKSRRTGTGSATAVQSSQAVTNVFQSRSAPTKSSAIRIYTDGSSLGNGKHGATAGVGVFFGTGDERNVSEPLQGPRQTNQRAELTAIQRALEIVPNTQDVQIITDSQYSINCVTKWHVSWENNSWKNSKKQDVENQDLVKEILTLIRTRQRFGASTDFIWIKGHSEDPGNEAADKLAVAGATPK